VTDEFDRWHRYRNQYDDRKDDEMTRTETLRNGTVVSVENIVRVFRSADASQLARGTSWYADAHTIALGFDRNNVRRAAGILAAVSPRVKWNRNITIAARTYVEGFASGTLNGSCAKATAILKGAEPLDVLGGPKTRAFFGVIVDPTNPTDVVVDRHAFDIAAGMVTNDKTRAPIGKAKGYETIAALYRDAARILGMSPSQVQAVTWIVWRETESIEHETNVKELNQES
jgi:hypothetical protein